MESTFNKIKFRHSNSDCSTFSKTFIFIGRAIKSTNEMSNIVDDTVGKTKEIKTKPYYKSEQIGNYVDPESKEKPSKILSRELPSNEVSVSLLISRNHNASISASCYFNSNQQQSLPIRKFNNERNLFPLKTPRLKIVEIPFEEKELIIKGAKMGGSPPYMPTSPPIFTWPNFKNSNKSDSTGIGSSLSVSSNNSSSGESDHFFSQNKLKDYRVISLDEKPNPGRLDDFIPEVERESSGMNGTLQREKKKESKEI
uniref:Uncharacterized protein n=1 Tax=Meloidogyne hapla TaxID=6305 RepID=A0A1I8AZF0_MELHA